MSIQFAEDMRAINQRLTMLEARVDALSEATASLNTMFRQLLVNAHHHSQEHQPTDPPSETPLGADDGGGLALGDRLQRATGKRR
jgi:hypothetical protein